VLRFYRRRIFQPAGRSSSRERSPSPAKKEGVRFAWRAFAVNKNAKDFTAQFATPVQIDPKTFSLKTYVPQSLTAPCYSNHRTPLLVANDRPRVRGTDGAFWRRVRVIPFDVKIPDGEVDPELSNKLRVELPGILAWAVRGCLKWQAERLPSPQAVSEATADWQRDTDHLTSFFNELLILAPGIKVGSSQLFSRYETWCSDNGETPLNIQEFNIKFSEKYDVTHTRVKGRSWWRGVKFQD
jgi:hypothetical protein